MSGRKSSKRKSSKQDEGESGALALIVLDIAGDVIDLGIEAAVEVVSDSNIIEMIGDVLGDAAEFIGDFIGNIFD